MVRTWGEPRQFDFEPKPHWDLGTALGIIDFERGVKISGHSVLRARGRRRPPQRPDRLDAGPARAAARVHQVYPPYLVRGECLVGTGQLPKFDENLYKDHEEDLWLIPTAEVPVTNLFRDEILEPGSLPIRLVAYTACFRREKMSAGRETRGLKRGHQFDKVEMVKFCAPEESANELRSLIRNAEEIPELLGIPYRIVQMCTGDLSFSAAAKFDVEMWAPGSQEWLDFQARRANIRYRPEEGARPQFVHTLNGSGLALPRTVIAIMENYQQADGSIVIPEVLRPYMGGQEVITGV